MRLERKIRLRNILSYIFLGLMFGISYNWLFYPHTLTEFLEAGSISILLGILLGFLEELGLNRFFTRIPFYQVLLMRTVIYSVVISGILAIVLSFDIATSEKVSYGSALVIYFQGPEFQRDFVFSLSFLFSIVFIVQVIQLLGKANFIRLIFGAYHNPKEVERIFMFLDLKNSAGTAEKLDNFSYSNFLKDFFFDISDAVAMFRGETYQYVGDEIVVTWPARKSNMDCILCYIKIIEIIRQKDDYYESRYGVRPEFKAGIHVGKVIMTEVGKYKKEVAYHGDTINIASRIEGKCNELNQSLLISRDLLSYLPEDHDFFIQEKGEISLKGKKEKLFLYGV